MAADPSVARLERPGLQAERTMLSWDRTILGVLANGVLLLLRHIDPHHSDQFAVVVIAVLVAALGVLARRRRGKALRTRALQRARNAAVEVRLLGGGVVVLGVAVLAFVVVESFVG